MENCKSCNEKLVTYDISDFISVRYCPNICRYNFYFEYKHECTKTVRVRHKTHIRNQCVECGDLVGNAIKRQNDFEFNKLQSSEVLKPLNDKYNSDIEKARELYVRYEKTAEDKWKERQNGFYEKYQKYLQSAEWKAKREKVFKRDNYLCQSCLEYKANEVHHLTYKHVFNEPLFDLISVCSKCHHSITSQDDFINGR